jgi:hypothetical protein
MYTGASERPAPRGHQQARQQWVCVIPDVACVRAVGCFSTRIPCATSDLLLNHLDATVATYKKKTDETLETNV